PHGVAARRPTTADRQRSVRRPRRDGSGAGGVHGLRRRDSRCRRCCGGGSDEPHGSGAHGADRPSDGRAHHALTSPWVPGMLYASACRESCEFRRTFATTRKLRGLGSGTKVAFPPDQQVLAGVGGGSADMSVKTIKEPWTTRLSLPMADAL